MEEHDVLFDLVKRLTPDEYRFVEQYALCGRKQQKKVLDLLRSMSALKTYDKRRLETAGTNLNSTKHLLRLFIFRALRAMRDGETADSQIRGMILDYEILYEKGMYGEAIRVLRNAEKLAREHRNLPRLMEVLGWQKHRILESETKDLVKVIQKKNEECVTTADALQQQWGLMNDYHLLFAKYRTQDGLMLPTDLEPVPASVLENPEAAFQSRLYGYWLSGLRARVRGDLKAARDNQEQLLQFWKANKNHLKDWQTTYKIMLANYAVYLFPEQDYGQIKALLKEIGALKAKNFNEEAEIFQNVANLKLLLQLNMRTKTGLPELVEEIEAGLERYAAKINAARQFSIWCNLMLTYFIHEDYRKVWEMIQKIVEHRRFQVRKEIQYITRLLEMVVYYELEIWDTPDSMVITVYRYLDRKEELTEFKKRVLGLFTQLGSTGIHLRQGKFAELLSELNQGWTDKTVADDLGMVVVKAWVASKVSGKRIVDEL